MSVLFTFNVPDSATATRVLNGLTTDYLVTVPDPANPGARISNPETRVQYAQRKIREHIASLVVTAEIAAVTPPVAPTVT